MTALHPLQPLRCLAWLLLVHLAGCDRPTPLPQAPVFSLPGLDDPAAVVASADLQQPAMLNLWASWCVPCRREMPQLKNLASVHGIIVYGLNYRDKPADARRWLTFYGNPYFRIGIDPEGLQLATLAEAGLPQTLVVDGAGRVRFHHVGPLTDRVVAERVLPLFNDSIR